MKTIYRILSVLQILFLISAYLAHWFSEKTMGMMRYTVYLNHKWEELYPIHTLQLIMMGIFAVIFSIALFQYTKKRQSRMLAARMGLPKLTALGVMTLLFLIFNLVFSTENFRSFYYISSTLALITSLQSVKLFIYLHHRT